MFRLMPKKEHSEKCSCSPKEKSRKKQAFLRNSSFFVSRSALVGSIEQEDRKIPNNEESYHHERILDAKQHHSPLIFSSSSSKPSCSKACLTSSFLERMMPELMKIPCGFR